MEELKLCKCGGIPKLKRKFTIDGYGKIRWYFAECEACGKSALPDTTPKDAVKAWNRGV